MEATTMAATDATKRKDTMDYEFGGPVGTAIVTAVLPVVTLWLAHCSDVGRADFQILRETSSQLSSILDSPVFCPECRTYPQLLMTCIAGVLAWIGFQMLLWYILPGEWVHGAPVVNKKNGATTTLPYKINGHLCFWVTLLVISTCWPVWYEQHNVWQLGPAPLELLYTYFAPLALVTIILCVIGSLFLYASSFINNSNKVLVDAANTGNIAYDFFLGRELNPRSFGGWFDWKEFCELRPGLIGWMLLNLSCLQRQHSTLGYVTGSMMLVNVFQGIYVWDALYQERAILTTMDITTDGFGYMLLFGDLAWVPFTYSIQARYLVKHDPHLSTPILAAILLLHVLGYAIFRGANGQKDAFRRNPTDPNLAHLKYLQTKRGTKLLTSGWWGLARKINYTGDWIMGLTWCLVAGFDSIVPYYYAIYFAILLVHRSIRDDHLCHGKYGDDWLEYKKLVPYRFIPGVV